MKNKGKFKRFSNVLCRCRCCGKKTHSNMDGVSTELCRVCLDSANEENHHYDGNHAPEFGGCPDHCPIKRQVECNHHFVAGIAAVIKKQASR